MMPFPPLLFYPLLSVSLETMRWKVVWNLLEYVLSHLFLNLMANWHRLSLFLLFLGETSKLHWNGREQGSLSPCPAIQMFFQFSKYSRKIACIYYCTLPIQKYNSDLSWVGDYASLSTNIVPHMEVINLVSPALFPAVHSYACALWCLPVHGCCIPQWCAGKLLQHLGLLWRLWADCPQDLDQKMVTINYYKASLRTFWPSSSPLPPHLSFQETQAGQELFTNIATHWLFLRMTLKERNSLSRKAAKFWPHKQWGGPVWRPGILLHPQHADSEDSVCLQRL